ncbi:precorrin-6A reductase [Levilactobacillus brevis]|uniref:Precorrin-6A reductase n=1 Tax=Levilactobacillus brevis TaxID=1580 RepID=A0A2A3TW12_LEVBR|nr:precorrin-6A reductase [Levilactobacillus brevis]MCT3567072.1 precorrin-6A reductase [Levilactobacillus brevis]PBQ22977.1 precorrin-6A reductase [Levilactobacillus brevis]
MILLLGGVSESLAIADFLTEKQWSFILSVTTDYGVELAQAHAKSVIKEIFQPDSLTAFIDQNNITLILDATHPFARVISNLAIAVAQKMTVAYLRFERQTSESPESGVTLVNDFAEVCGRLSAMEGLIYLSTGSKTAPDYAQVLGLDRLHVRVLPTTSVLSKLTTAGFDATQIDAIRGPFTTNLNIELFRRVNAAVVVTKESGKQGGVQEKIAAAQALSIPCLVIRRPVIDYPRQVSNLTALARALEMTS